MDPKPEPMVLLEVPLVERLDEPEAEEADDMRSVKRLVEPRAAPRLAAAELAEPEGSEEDEVLFAVLEELIVTLDALAELEDEEVEAAEEEPPNMLADADVVLREDIRLPP